MYGVSIALVMVAMRGECNGFVIDFKIRNENYFSLVGSYLYLKG